MKIYHRLLALLAVLMLAVSTIGTADTSAATKPSLNVTSRVIYVGGSKVMAASSAYSKDTYTLKVKNRPAKYACTWESSDESVATVEKNKYKGIVTAVAPGTATITVSVVDKTTSPNTCYVLSCEVEVRENCAAVAITPSSVAELKPGEDVQLTGTMYTASARQATPGRDTTDIIHWISSNTKVATVSSDGLVKAVGEGTAEITCYTVQAPSGTYSQYRKATAKDTVSITVKSPDIKGITAVKQNSLNTLSVYFDSDYSSQVTTANFKINRGIYGEATIKSLTFDESGMTATVVMDSALSSGYTYTASMTGTKATVGTSIDFTVSDRTPAKLQLYTDIDGNKIIAGETTTLKYKLYDKDGVDITPIDSSNYSIYASYINCTSTETTPSFLYSVYERDIWIGEAGKTLTVKGTYSDGRTTLTGYVTITSVTEASTMTLAGTTITNQSVSGSKLDWDNPVNRISLSDVGEGYKIVARVQKSDGSYIYSNDYDSKITFEFAENYTANAMFISSPGTITPLVEGYDRVLVMYDGTCIGICDVQIGPARVPRYMKFLVDGVESNKISMSDAYVTNPTLSIALYDNYNELYRIIHPSLVDITLAGSSDYSTYALPASSVNSNGTLDVTFYLYGAGTTSGKTYTFTVKYSDGTTTLAGTFAAIVYQPVTTASSSYEAVITGDRDMVVSEAGDEEQDVVVSFIEKKGSVRYAEVPLKLKDSATVGDYYVVVKGPDQTELDSSHYSIETDTSLLSSADRLVIHTVTNTAGTISKLTPGSYTVSIYRKNSGTSDTLVSGKQIILTDSQKGAEFTQTARTTAATLSSTTSSSIVDFVFNECFDVTIDGATASSVHVTDCILMDGAVYIKTADVAGTINLGGTSYVMNYSITVGKLIQSTNK